MENTDSIDTTDGMHAIVRMNATDKNLLILLIKLIWQVECLWLMWLMWSIVKFDFIDESYCMANEINVTDKMNSTYKTKAADDENWFIEENYMSAGTQDTYRINATAGKNFLLIVCMQLIRCTWLIGIYWIYPWNWSLNLTSAVFSPALIFLVCFRQYTSFAMLRSM